MAARKNLVERKSERQPSTSSFGELDTACREWMRYWFEWVIRPHSARDEEIDKKLAELTEEQKVQLVERVEKKRGEAQEAFQTVSEKLIGACFDFNMNGQAEALVEASISFPYSAKDMQGGFFATNMLLQRVHHEQQKALVAQGSKTKITVNSVRDRLMSMCRDGKAYASTRKLAKLIGCSPSTITDAISGTATLKAWAGKSHKECKPNSPAVHSVTKVVVDTVPSNSETDPAGICLAGYGLAGR